MPQLLGILKKKPSYNYYYENKHCKHKQTFSSRDGNVTLLVQTEISLSIDSHDILHGPSWFPDDVA